MRCLSAARLRRSERRRCAGGDDHQLAFAGVRETVRAPAVEAIGVAFLQLIAPSIDLQSEPPLYDKPGLLALVRQHLRPRSRARTVAFVNHLQAAPAQVRA